ncbi:MAG: SCP2 sterol-binding domain-containing protein [Parvibaculum sp.]
MATPSEALKLVSEITEFLKQSLPADAMLGARLKFVYPDVGVVMIDGSKAPNVVSNRDEEADCIVEIDPAVHLKMLHLEMDQGLAFRRGLMRISGDVAVAVRLGPLLARSKPSGAL